MSEVSNPFDFDRDYFAELLSSEKYKDDQGREYPYLKGLQRLAHTHRGGVREVRSRICKTPNVGVTTSDGETKMTPDCIASVTVSYGFKDGSVFEASADASYKAHDAPFNLHLVAVAESKAEARAIRKAFNIRQVSKEEVGSEGAADFSGVDGDEPATDVQLHGLRKVLERKGLSEVDLCKKMKVEKLELLTFKDAHKAMAKVHKMKAVENE